MTENKTNILLQESIIKVRGAKFLQVSYNEDTELPRLNEDTMPGILGDIVLADCKDNEVDPMSVLLDVLSHFGTHVSNPYIEYRGFNQHCHMNFATVGNSSRACVGTSSNTASRIFGKILDKPQYLEGHLSTGENLLNAVRDHIPSSANNRGNQVTLSPSTSDKRLLFRENEIRFAFANAKRPGNSLLETVSGLFKNGNAELTVNSGKISATAAHVSIFARTSCTDFSALTNDANQSGEFASHFLWFLVDRFKPVPRPKGMTDEEVESFRKRIERIILAANSLERIEMSNTAWVLWDKIYPALTKTEHGVAGIVVSRSEIHTIRLALLYALVAERKRILAKDLGAAFALVQYAQESASIIFKGDLRKNKDQKILCALHVAPNHEMSRTEISEIFGRNVDSGHIDLTLKMMEKSKLIEIEKKDSKIGRKKTIIRLVSNKL